MRFHFGPYRATVRAEPTLPYPIPPCRHLDHKPTPPDLYQIRVMPGQAPAQTMGFRVAVEEWTADLAADEGTIYLHPSSPPDYDFFNELFAAIGIGRTLLDGGFVIHASSIVADGSAFIFTGVSGAGKSTLAQHLGAGRRISDDQALILPTADGWWCRNAFLLEHEGARAGRIFVIEQASQTSLEALPLRQALPRVMRHLVLWRGDPRIHAQVLDNLGRFLTDIPCFRLAVGLQDISLSQLCSEVQ